MSHLKESNLSYFKHLMRAIGFSFKMAALATYCLIHAIFPNSYTTTYSETINRAYELLKEEEL